jgi:membrane protein required for colicin V production
MNTLDVIVLAVIGLSGLFAFARGFVKEVLSIAAWLGAAAVAFYTLPYTTPIAAKLFSAPTMAEVAAGLVVFLVALIVFSILASSIGRRVKGSALSALDRTLGLVFGLGRGVALVCLGWLAATWALPEKDWPDWARGARTKPFLVSGAETLRGLVPGHARERGAALAAEAQQKAEQAREADRLMRAFGNPPHKDAPPGPAAAGYKPAERKDMDRLFQNAQ